MTRRGWIVTALAAGVAFAAGLSLARWWSVATPPAGPATDLLQQEFLDLDGGKRRLKDLAGRTVLVNFWATWCAPCRREMPLFQSLHAQYADKGLQVVAIALDNAEAVRRFRDEFDLRFPLWLDNGPAAALMARYGNRAGGLPFSLWLGPKGSVLSSKLGAYKEPALTQAVQAYLPRDETKKK